LCWEGGRKRVSSALTANRKKEKGGRFLAKLVWGIDVLVKKGYSSGLRKRRIRGGDSTFVKKNRMRVKKGRGRNSSLEQARRGGNTASDGRLV